MKLGIDIISLQTSSSSCFEFHDLGNSSIMTMLTSDLEIYWRQFMLRNIFKKQGNLNSFSFALRIQVSGGVKSVLGFLDGNNSRAVIARKN
jgi:hypothetical protein